MKHWFVVCLLFPLFSLGFISAEEIHDAARRGDLERVRTILERDPRAVAGRDRDRKTPLHHAVEMGRMETASLLLERGADVGAADFQDFTPLHAAANRGNAAAVKMLLAHKADPHRRNMRGRTPLFLACNWGNDLETARLLLDAGSDVNDRTPTGEVLLVSTLFYGRREIIDLLLDRGAVLPDDEDTLRRVLFVTASNGLERPFRLAVEKSGRREISWWTGIPIHAAARGGSVDIARALLEKGADLIRRNLYGVEPLHIAAENGRADMAVFLLANGAKVDSPSLVGKTALHYARDNRHEALAELLIEKGASQAPPRFPLLEGEFLGQESPGGTPRIFAPGIVSGHGFSSEHSPAVFSPDGNEVYWTPRFRGPILCMKQTDGIWSAPEPAPFNSEFGDGEPVFSPDGGRLFFLSFRPLDQGGASDKENMWVVERTASGWSEAKPVSPRINACDLHWMFSVTRNGNIYFASTRDGGRGMKDIYVSRRVEDGYSEPENLGGVINTPGIDHTPFAAPDENFLIYVSSRDSSSPADFRFLISFRETDGSWGSPVDAGPEVNSIEAALCPAVTPDGKYLFFIGRGDIYWVEAGFIEECRKRE